MSEKLDSNSKYEQIIAQEVSNLGLNESGLGALEASGRVSEVVGENAQENMTGSAGGQDDAGQKGVISQAVTNLIFARPAKSQDLVLPAPSRQKAEVKKAIAKRTRELVDQATKLQRSPQYSAAKMEKIIYEIRQLRKVMTQLLEVTVEQLENLYRKYVWKQ